MNITKYALWALIAGELCAWIALWLWAGRPSCFFGAVSSLFRCHERLLELERLDSLQRRSRCSICPTGSLFTLAKPNHTADAKEGDKGDQVSYFVALHHNKLALSQVTFSCFSSRGHVWHLIAREPPSILLSLTDANLCGISTIVFLPSGLTTTRACCNVLLTHHYLFSFMYAHVCMYCTMVLPTSNNYRIIKPKYSYM